MWFFALATGTKVVNGHDARLRRADFCRCAATLVAAVLVTVAAAGCGRSERQAQSARDVRAPVPQSASTEATGTAAGQRLGKSPDNTLIIFHAASLARPFGDLEKLFEQRHPGVDVVRESGASLSELRKITELGRKCDVFASSDYTLIDELLIPNYASYDILFVRERIVVAYTQRSRYASEITSDNWYEILLRPDVKVGYANPLQAPVGWRTLLVWKLADRHYGKKIGGKSIYEGLRKKIPDKHVVPDVAALEPLLESLELDYAFMYKATAMQHNLQWIKLPDEIDLGNEKLADQYAKVEVEVRDKSGRVTRHRGEPLLYGATVLKDAPHPELAVEWLQLLFSPEGREVLEKNFLEVISPPLCKQWNALPASLQGVVKSLR